MSTLNRRKFLAAAAAAVPASVAGCTEFLDDEEGGAEASYPSDQLPRYDRWLSADAYNEDEEGISFSHIDWYWFIEAGQTDENPFAPADADSLDDLEEADLMVALPAVAHSNIALQVSLGLSPYEFIVELIEGGDGDTGVADVHRVGGLLILEGHFDRAQVEEEADGFDLVEERDGFDLYDREDAEEGGEQVDLSFAASESAIVVALADPEVDDIFGRVEAAVDAATGEGDTLSDIDSDADDALRQSGHGKVVIGGWNSDPLGRDDDGDDAEVAEETEDDDGDASDDDGDEETEEDEGDEDGDEETEEDGSDEEAEEADEEGDEEGEESEGGEDAGLDLDDRFDTTDAEVESVVASFDVLDDRSEASARVVMVFDGDAPDEDEIEDEVGFSADDLDIDRDDDRFLATGTWHAD